MECSVILGFIQPQLGLPTTFSGFEGGTALNTLFCKF